MKTILICASERPAAAFFERSRPLALVPVFGRTLIDLWLEFLGAQGAKEVRILASDRPEDIRAAVGRGERWGLKAEVFPEQREWTPEEARRRHRKEGDGAWLPNPWDVVLMDRFPGSDGEPLWGSPQAYWTTLLSRLPAAAPTRIGFRELSPGVYVSGRARISPLTRLKAPCWVGENAWTGATAEIGPNAIVEDGCYVDQGATVRNSWIGPATYVGGLTEITESLAWGRGLCKWPSGSFTEVADAFLLSDLHGRATRLGGAGWLGRAAAAIALGVTAPALGVAWLRHRGEEGPLFIPKQAVRTPLAAGALIETAAYYELAGFRGLWRRWPELLNVARGEFAWVGNRPLTREMTAELRTDFERLWLAARSGIFSLADAEGCADGFSDEAKAHSSFYAAVPEARQNFTIVRRVIQRALTRRVT